MAITSDDLLKQATESAKQKKVQAAYSGIHGEGVPQIFDPSEEDIISEAETLKAQHDEADAVELQQKADHELKTSELEKRKAALGLPSTAKQEVNKTQFEPIAPQAQPVQPTQTAQASAPGGVGLIKSGLDLQSATEKNVGEKQSNILGQQANVINNKTQEAIDSQKHIDNVKLKVDSASKKVTELMNQGIQPKGFFEGKTTFQKIIGGLGLFMSSLSPQSAQNAIKIIDDAINTDIDVQQRNLNAKREGAKSLLQQNMDEYKELKTAKEATKLQQLQAFEVNLKQVEASAKGDYAKSKAQIGLGQLQEEIRKHQDTLSQSLLKLQYESAKDNRPLQVNGFDGVAPDAKSASELRETNIKRTSILDGLKQLSVINNTPGASMNPSMRAKAAQITNDIQLSMKEVAKLGVLSGDDSKRLDHYITNPAEFSTLKSTVASQIAGMTDLVNKAVDTRAKALGMSRTQVVPGAKQI